MPITAHSALLTERLAEMDDRLGKPSSAIELWQQALQLHPSLEQGIRIRLTLADKLVVAKRTADAIDNYKQLLSDAPDYPGKASITEKLGALEQAPAAIVNH